MSTNNAYIGPQSLFGVLGIGTSIVLPRAGAKADMYFPCLTTVVVGVGTAD